MLNLRYFLCFLWIACAPLLAQASASGSLSGQVSDAQGSIANVTVLLSAPSFKPQQTLTDAAGRYSFERLSPGKYTITFSRAGYESIAKSAEIQAQPLTVDASLGVSSVATTLEVADTVNRSALQLDSTATGGTLLNIPVRELPASISIVSQQMMQERGARTGLEAAELSVGMIAGASVGSIPSFTTRGFGGNNITMMRDGIRQNTVSQSARPLDSFLMERMEVLKGPASVLYGEGAIGGAINVVSKEAQPRLLVDGLLSYGSFNTLRSGLGINGPINKKLFVRADVSYFRTDGYTRNSAQDLTGVSTALRYNATENLVLSLNGSWGQDFTSSYYGTPLIDGRIDPRTRFLNYNMEDNLAKSRNRFARANLDWRLPKNWQLRNSTFVATHTLDWRNFEAYAYNPTTRLVDVSSYFLIWRNDILTGNRTDLQGSFRFLGRNVRSVVGAQYQRNDLQRGGLSDNSIRRSLDPFNPTPFFDPGRSYVRDRDVVIGTLSIFSEAVMDITTKLKAIGGMRFERIALDYTTRANNITASSTYKPTTGRAGLIYNITPTVNVYGSFTRAVEPVAQLVSLPGASQAFSLVPGTQLEFGSKVTAMRGRLDLTAAYFDIEKRDILTTTIVDGVQLRQQIGRQLAKGVEFTSLYRPTRTFTISADLAFTDAKFADFNEIIAGGNVSRSGNLPPNVPETVLSFWANQRLFEKVDLSGTLRHVGRRFADTANLRPMDDYTTFDAALTYRLPKGMNLALRGRNLSDAQYAIISVSGGTALRLEAPRSVDLTFTMRF